MTRPGTEPRPNEKARPAGDRTASGPARPCAPIRVGYLIHCGGRYGVSRQTASLVEALDRKAVTPVGLLFGDGQEPDGPGALCDERVQLETRPLLPLSDPRHGRFYLPNLARKLRVAARVARQAAAAIRRLQLELVHVNFWPFHLIASEACRRAGIPCVWHLHGSLGGAGWRDRLQRSAWNLLPAHIVCNSRFTQGTLPARARRRSTVIYNGVAGKRIQDERQRGALRAQIGVPAAARLVGMFGSLNPYKGHEYFIQAAVEVVRSCPSTVFVVVGGETPTMEIRLGRRAALRRTAETLGISANFRFTGYLPDAYLYMGDCDVICVPTVPVASCLGEGFGLVTAEAMANGVAVVGTNCGATPEIVQDGKTGLLVPPRDAGALSAAICQLLGNDAGRKAMGQRAKERVAQSFDVTHTARAVEKVYRLVAGRHGPSKE